MDLRTVMLMLAVGSFLFGLLLIVFRMKKNSPQIVPYWITAKHLQAAGFFMLYLRTNTFDGLPILANTALILGCSYEAWAVRFLTGRLVKHRLHLSISVGIILVCLATIFLDRAYRAGLIFLLQSTFFFLPSLFLFGKSGMKFSLQLILAACYFLTGSVFLISAVLCLGFPQYALSLAGDPIFGVIPVVSFCIFLISGFILLMLAKEKSDLQIVEMQKALEKTQIQFQRIVETAIEGILIFDKDYRITFANKNMASMLGYTVNEMLGRSYISFFPESQLDVYKHQESLRKKGLDSVYECCLLRKDGQKHWFLISAKPIFDDYGRFEGSFGMFTDINERKEMELLLEETNRQLTELSNKDSLTGIPNRRCFDATLEHEYSRLRRSKSKLSVILLDIDHFKEYNDYYGHVMGDDCLRQVGKVLTSCISRSVDLAARYGGEEFACILPDTDIHGAVKIAERIRQRIQDLKIEHKKSSVSEFVTASFGVITVRYSPKVSLADIVAMADKLLYKAKVSGRNRIVFAELKGDKSALLQRNA
ncbi:MAG: sensor domain-containing diguanylate cyclase [Bacillota bacterium]|jgi:diguanylate cyclase (GGDEF)-like protein/PAS domain S-box-containing protein